MHVLGRMRVEVDGRELTSPPSGRPWALLAYLAINPGLHARGELAARVESEQTNDGEQIGLF